MLAASHVPVSQLSVFGLLIAPTIIGILSVALFTWRLTYRRVERFIGARLLVYAITAIIYLLFWLPGFIVGGYFGGSILSAIASPLVGVFLGFLIATCVPAILGATVAGALVLRSENTRPAHNKAAT